MKTINTTDFLESVHGIELPSREEQTNGKRLLSKKETMEYLGITYDMVNVLIRLDGFPVVRLGRPNSKRPRVFIDKDQLNSWILEHTGY